MNHTRHIEFILLWLTDNSPLQIVVFVFLLLNYMLNVTGDLIIIVLTLLESHLKTPMYISLHNFSFLEISFTSSCTPRFPITTVTRENMISYIGCMSQLFFYIFLGVTKFFLLGASPVTCCDLQAFALYIRHEQHNLSSAGAQFLGNWLPGHFPSSDFGSSPGFLWFKCHWPFHLWYFSYPTSFFLRHTFTRNGGMLIRCGDPQDRIAIGNSFLLLHHQDNYKFPL